MPSPLNNAYQSLDTSVSVLGELPTSLKRLEDLYGVDLASSKLAEEVLLVPNTVPNPEPLSLKNLQVIPRAEHAKLDDDFLPEEIADHDDFDETQIPRENELGKTVLNESTQKQVKGSQVEENETDIILLNLKALTNRYHYWNEEYFKPYESLQGKLLFSLEYFKINEDNWDSALRQLPLSPEQFQSARDFIKIGSSVIKWTDNLGPFVYNIAKLCIINQVQKELTEIDKLYQAVRVKQKAENSSSQPVIQHCINQFAYKLSIEKKQAAIKRYSKSQKILPNLVLIPFAKEGIFSSKIAARVCKSSINILRNISSLLFTLRTLRVQRQWVQLAQTRITHDCHGRARNSQSIEDTEAFLKRLNDCKSIEEVEKIIHKYQLNCEVPLSLEQWSFQLQNKRFLRQIIQTYYSSRGKKALMNNDHIRSILLKREEEYNIKVKNAGAFVANEIQVCTDKKFNFDEIKKHFKSLHIDLETVALPVAYPIAPQTKNDWDTYTQDPEFCQALAKHWIDYQETISQLAMQGFRQSLLIKNSVERKFLFFRGFEYVTGIATSILQMFVLLPSFKLWAASAVIELLISDLSKFGIPGSGLIPFLHPLFMGLNFKVDNLILMVVKNLFAVRYKPNEYSLEGYQLMFQVRYFQLVVFTHYILSSFQQTILLLNIRIIENYIRKNPKTPLCTDKRSIKINEKFEQRRVICKDKIKIFEEKLSQLMLKDTKMNLTKEMKKVAGDPEFDPIQNLAEALNGANVSFFSPQIIEFFEDNAGINLTNPHKDSLQKMFENLLLEGEDEFVGAFEANQYAFLKE